MTVSDLMSVPVDKFMDEATSSGLQERAGKDRVPLLSRDGEGIDDQSSLCGN